MAEADPRFVEVEEHVAVGAPTERIWALLTDHEHMPHWMPVREVVRRRAGQPEPDGVGAIRTVRGGGLVLDEEIVVFEPASRLVYRLLGGAPVRDHEGEVTLEAAGPETRVRWRVRFRPRVPGTGRLLGWFLRRALADGLAGLRQLAETGQAPRRRGKMRRRV